MNQPNQELTEKYGTNGHVEAQEIISRAPAPWQPIETAPSDQTVLVCGRGYRGYYVADAKLIDGVWYLFDPLGDGYSADSEGHTHWMPLPAPPEITP